MEEESVDWGTLYLGRGGIHSGRDKDKDKGKGAEWMKDDGRRQGK